jgi:hypothetical protein
MSTPTVHRYHTTEYLSRMHGDEFIVVIDALGRRWNPLKHPRDSKGRFIRTFSFVTFDLPGGGTASGRVSGIDRDGNLLVKVQGVTPGAPPGMEGGYVKVPHDKVTVRTVKAQLGGKGASGRLNKQENDSVTKGVNNLRRLGMDTEADKLAEAQTLAMGDPKAPDAPANKQRAIDLMREVGETLGNERGKGFDEGTDYEEIKANLTPDERARLQTLDAVMGTTFTARHSLGDRALDAENDEGPIKAKAGEVRIQAAESELTKDFTEDAPVWDITSGSLVEGHLEQPVKAEVRDTVREQEGTDALPELQRSTYQRLKSGLSRLSGYKQAAQVAPGDRFHADKDGNEVVVGAIVNVDATKSRGAFTGMVTRIYTDKDGKKHVYARDFDPSGDKGYPKNYKDHSVQGGSIELAGDNEQNTLFQSLALQGSDAASKSLVKSFTQEYLDTMERRYASPDAKRISPTGGFFDVAPVHSRTRKDSNGEAISIGDSVFGPNGEAGVVTYIEPNENTVKVQYPNGQKASRVSSTKLTRSHGPSSDVYPGESGYGDNNYVPTREEAAVDADEMGASSVAQVIRDGGDARAIQAAMTTDVAFQGELDSVDALYDKRDQTLGAGQELGEEDRTKLAQWDRLAAASAGQFREEPERPPEVPEAPSAESEEPPENPANPTEKVTEGGVTLREDGENVVVDDDIEDPIPADDQQAIDQAVDDAEQAQEPGAADEEPPAPALAQRLLGDVGKLVEEAKQGPNVDNNQRAQLNQMLGRLGEAVTDKDGDAVVRSLQGLTTTVNRQVNANLRQTRLAAVLNGRATNGVPMADFVQQKLDAGEDIFGAPEPVRRPDRPAERPDETPEGVDPKVDQADNAVSEALLMDDGTTMVMVGDQQVDEGFYVMDPATVTEYDAEPTTADITEFLNETQGSDYDGISVWHDETDGRFRMARVGVFDNEQDASDAAANSSTNQYVNIADGAIMNVATGGDPNTPTEAVEDPRSEERAVRVAGAGRAAARSTSKQKKMLDHVAETSGDADLGRIATAIKNGEEISGADASRLADAIDGMGADQFDKPSDKGVASQMAHKLARAAGEEGARGYSSQNTALRRTSDVGISLSAQSQDDTIRSLVDGARTDIKNGDNAAAAAKFREAADAFDALGLGTDVPSRRGREHADRLDAMGGVTAPAPQQAPTPAAETQGGGTAREALDAAGMPEVDPLTTSQFSNPNTPRTRQVTPQEYTALALKGRDRLDGLLDNSTAPDALQGQTWDEVKNQAWDSVQEEWGGITIDAHTGQAVTGDEDAYAITFRPPGVDTVSVPIGSSREEFDAAMEQALAQFGSEQDSPLWAESAHLGVFRNDDTGNYEIDPSLVFDNLDDVEAVGAYSGSEGGAYNFKDGLGYWPPHVAEEQAGGPGQAEPEGVSGTRRLEGTGPQGGEAQPGLPPQEQAQGPAGGGPEAPEVAQVTSVLGTVESAISDEQQAEGDNGPQGWTDALDEANAQLGLIRGRVTDEGPYTELSDDLRALAQHIEDNWRLSDPSDAVDELRRTADALDGSGPGTPEGGTPGGEGGGDAPFRVGDHATLHAAISDEGTRAELRRIAGDYLQAQLSKHQKLLDQAEEGSLAHTEVNRAKREVWQRFNAADYLLENTEGRATRGTLTPQDVTNALSYSGGPDGEKDAVDIWNGNGPDLFSNDSLDEFMAQRIQQAGAGAQAEADEATADRPVDLQYIDARFRTDNERAVSRMENGRITSLDEYQQLVGEMGSILATIDTLRDPANRVGLRKDQVAHLKYLASRIDADAEQARTFLDELDAKGIDGAPLRNVLDGTLGKYDATDLISAPTPMQSREKLAEQGTAYFMARNEGKPATTEATAVMQTLADIARDTNSAREHGYLAGAMRKTLLDQIGANNGTIPEPIKKVLRDPALGRFGVFHDMIARADMEDIAATDPDNLGVATGGRYEAVEWDQDTTVSAELVSDDRSFKNGEIDTTWNHEIEQVTPNVSAALNAMWTQMGGGIHRTDTNITEADTADAAIWRAQGWNRDVGADERPPDEVQGVYTKTSNNVIVADNVLGRRRTSVVVHELGHALDSMLGEMHAENRWFTQIDPEFQAFHEKLKRTASFNDANPDDSILYWYFRDRSEGSRLHNGSNGVQEVWAEGYAAYAWAKQQMAEEDFQHQLPANKELIYTQVGRSLTMDTGRYAVEHGKRTRQQVKATETAMGHLIFDYFEDLETRRLPEIMTSGPHIIPKNSELRAISQGVDLGAPPVKPVQKIATQAQKTKADTHLSKQHGLIQMTPIERGSPEWAAMEAAVKQVSPGATMPPPSALYVTWNPAFAEQGNTVIWKSVMPGEPKYTVEYTDQHKATQLAAKFQRQQRVNVALDEVHAKAEAEAAYDETAALVLAMIETGMRVGSSERAGSIDKKTGKKVPTFGGATMQAKHVFFPSDSLMRFKFPGKAGKENIYESRNPALRAAVQQLLEGKKPSDQVFAGTNSGRTIDYIRTATGIDDIINHDTRTRYATNMARSLVAKWPKSRMPKNEAALKRAKTEIAKKVGIAINDTWTVARDSYISNAVWEPMEDSAGVPHSFDDSPPYGLVEGETVTTGVPGAPGGPSVPGEGVPAPAVASAADWRRAHGFAAQVPEEEPVEPQTDGDDEPETYTLDQSPEAVAERAAWYSTFVWPEPPVVAGPDTTFSAEDGDDEPAQTEETREVE